MTPAGRRAGEALCGPQRRCQAAAVALVPASTRQAAHGALSAAEHQF